MSKSRFLVPGIAVAGVACAVAAGFAAPYLARSFMPHLARGVPAATAVDSASVRVADKTKDAVRVDVPGAKADTGNEVRVRAPYTAVQVGKDTGKVAVTAPHTDVKVDPDKGRVQVRAPYVNLDIRW